MASVIEVSILAHPERWALLDPHVVIMRVRMFQSSPTPKGGRYFRDRGIDTTIALFQSSPTPKGGRYRA